MTNESLKAGKDLTDLINVTSKALDELEKFKSEERESQATYDDNSYWLAISEHRDGSGIRADLYRYYGNKRLLDVIKKELNDQLNEFKSEFEKL